MVPWSLFPSPLLLLLLLLLVLLILPGSMSDPAFRVYPSRKPQIRDMERDSSGNIRSTRMQLRTAQRKCLHEKTCYGFTHAGSVTDGSDEAEFAFIIHEPSELLSDESFTTYLRTNVPKRAVADEENSAKGERDAVKGGEAREDSEEEAGATGRQEEAGEADEKDGTCEAGECSAVAVGEEGDQGDHGDPEFLNEDEDDDGIPLPDEKAEALYLRANELLYATGYEDRNVTAAVQLYNESAAMGHAGAQFMMGVIYSTGLGGVEPSEMLAILYHTFAAMSGNVESALALSYRYNYGHGVPKSCGEAVKYSRMVADKVAKSYRWHGVIPKVNKVRLVDPSALRTRQREEGIIQYYQFAADRGEASSQMVIGYAHMWGIRGAEQDAYQALRYFTMAADRGEAAAYGALGSIYAQGMPTLESPIPKDHEKAFEYFTKGAEMNHQVSLNGLGYMYMMGYGTEKSYEKAIEYFKKAAAQSNAEAEYNLGVLYLHGQGVPADFSQALKYLKLAANQGQVLAHWQLGVLYQEGEHVGMVCTTAVKHFRAVSEKGEWFQRIEEANRLFLEGEYASSLLHYIITAEQGYEIGQSNAAYMFDYDRGFDELGFRLNKAYAQDGPPPLNEDGEVDRDYVRYNLAMRYYKRAMEQDQVDAIVRIGDFHYYGMGTKQDVGKAVQAYKMATERRSSRAMFNLGYMYEHGIGVEQDFHQAKRYYDMSYETTPLAYWPTTLALLKLQAHMWLASFSSSSSTPSGAPQSPPAGKKGGGDESGAILIFGYNLEDFLLGTMLLLLFLCLFIRHNAGQMVVPPVAPVAPAPQPAQQPAQQPVQQPAPQAAPQPTQEAPQPTQEAPQPTQEAPQPTQAASSAAQSCAVPSEAVAEPDRTQSAETAAASACSPSAPAADSSAASTTDPTPSSPPPADGNDKGNGTGNGDATPTPASD